MNISCKYFKLSNEFKGIIEAQVGNIYHDVILNFRDPSYSPEMGGFHPVEIYIRADGTIQYITDFSYVGSGGYGGAGAYAELAKVIDFDFLLRLFQHFGHEYPIEQGRELYEIWQQNFVSYYHMDIYQVSIELQHSKQNRNKTQKSPRLITVEGFNCLLVRQERFELPAF